MKLGLIAMSGVRIHNEELMRLGLTLPGFVERSKVIASLPSLGLLTLAGMTPTDVHVRYLDVPDLSTVDDFPEEFDAVAISSFTARIKDAYILADRYRAAGTKVLLGGLHVTAMPEEARAHADSVLLGEGEVTWPQAIQDLKDGRLQPLYDGRQRDFPLSSAPMPRFDLLDMDRYNRITVQTQRGCPFLCDFCASSITIAPRFKVKPIEKVVAEIQRIKQTWRRPFIEFADDNSFANKVHGKRLCRALAKEQIRWFTETDISVANDPELLVLLRDSGCAQLLIGFESPKRSILEGIETRANWKAEQADKYLTAIDRIQSHGITVNGCFILGLDDADESGFIDVLQFIRDSSLYEAQITVQTPFPGTPLYERLKRQGRLLAETAWETCTLFDVNFHPKHMSVHRLEEQFRWLMKQVYSDSERDRRRSRYRQHLRRTST